MKTNLRTLFASAAATVALAATSNASLILTGVIDGDLTGGNPKAVVITATAAIADLSAYGLGAANNGGGTDGQEATFAGSVAAGQTILVVASNDNSDFFTNNYSDSFVIFVSSNGAGINGDDAVELFFEGAVIDTYGDPDTNGDGETWDYTDGYAVRIGGAAGAFDQANYASSFQGLDTLDEAQHISTIGTAFGFTPVPEPSIALLSALGVIGLVRRRR